MRVSANGPAVVVLALMVNLPYAALAQPAVSHQPAEYGVVVEKNLMIPVRDGVRLAADILPASPGGQARAGASPRS